MEHSIGVGAIVGLTLASSLYIWNSEQFTSSQKTVLLICVIFPPAQWLGILIVSIYNTSVINNSDEKVNERKSEQIINNLDSSVKSLSDLKDKGVITEVFYFKKVAEIKAKIAKEELENLIEYKQLKNLLKNGILSKEDFEDKIINLQKFVVENPPKNIRKEEIKPEKFLSEAEKIAIQKELDENSKKYDKDFYTTIIVLIIVGVVVFTIGQMNK